MDKSGINVNNMKLSEGQGAFLTEAALSEGDNYSDKASHHAESQQFDEMSLGSVHFSEQGQVGFSMIATVNVRSFLLYHSLCMDFIFLEKSEKCLCVSLPLHIYLYHL